MDGFYTNKKYDSYKIQERQQVQGDESTMDLPHTQTVEPISLDQGSFYEIEYDSCPIPGVGKFILKPQKIEEPEKDEKRDLFGQMRDIARAHRSAYDNSRFFNQRVQQDNAIIFYKQGMFMKDFSDDYCENVEFSQYFPYYQQMGYAQLRTYFTWRKEVRKGTVVDISLSYAFLYIYELLNNIGVSDPQDGLNQLMSFWRAFANFNKSIDKYVIRWLKDYHIYYELPHSFQDFVDSNNLTRSYPKMAYTTDKFTMFCNLSKYDIRKSTFYTDDNMKLITDCFYFVINKLKQIFEGHGINFDESIFQATKKMSEWKPFKDALFYPWMKQANRQIVLSENEIYICNNNKWSFSTVLTSESGRQLIGYILKQMEVALRKVTIYKYKLSANLEMVSHEAVGKLNKAGLSLETIVNDAVAEFYKEATKTVVIVDQVALSRIRQEALVTQEKLIVPEQEKMIVPEQEKLIVPEQEKMIVPEQEKLIVPEQEKMIVPEQMKLIFPEQESQFVPVIPVQTQLNLSFPVTQDKPFMPLSRIEPTPERDIWESLKSTLTKVEIKALSVVLHGETNLKKYADECGIMLEVLVDGINEKAMDIVGDNLLDDGFALYDDYKEQVKELIA
jgi:hypothetical protein